MTTTAALILSEPDRFFFGGSEPIERTALLLGRAGITDQHVVGDVLDERAKARLREAGISVTCTSQAALPFVTAPDVDRLLVLPAHGNPKPSALRTLVSDSALSRGEAALVVGRRRGSSRLLLLSRHAIQRVRTASSLTEALRQLAETGHIVTTGATPLFADRFARMVILHPYKYGRHAAVTQ